jgi:hypothetical protein
VVYYNVQSIRRPSTFHHRSYHPVVAHQALSAVGLHGLAVRHYSAKGEILGLKSRTISHVTLVFDPGEQDTADLIGGACANAVRLIQQSWGLKTPEDCRIYVMTSWLGFVFQSAPWHWRILLGATMPLWCFRARRTWPYSAAWTQRYGRRVAIGVKPPHLLEQSDRSIGVRMFVEEKDMKVNVQHVTCHELTHACSAHLKLPAWLNEGIATVTVDRFLERRTIREETLELVRGFLPKGAPPTYRELSRMSFVNGYLLDILLPFAFYFLLCLNEFSLLRSWIVKSTLVFGVGSAVEIAQFFGVPIFGRTFDPLDFVMYGIGVISAAILDTTVFPRIFEFWTPKARESA